MFTVECYPYLISSAAITIMLIFLVDSRSKKRHTLPLPPGPRGSWVEGVALHLPKSEPWCTYAEWSAQYNSPIISFRVYNRRLVVLNSAVAADALLTRRSAIYSERPHSTMYNVICGRGKSVFNINASDPLHKRYRTLIQGELGPNGTRRYMGLIEEEAKNLARALLRRFDGRDKAEPDVGAFVKDVERNAVGVILKMAFGYTVKENADASGEGRDAGDPFLRASAEAAKISGWAMQPGRWLVDYIPILRFVPAWMPGAGWKRQGLAWRNRLLYLADIPHAWAKQQMETGIYEESFTSRLLRRRSGNNGRPTGPASSFPSSSPGSWSSCPSPIPSFAVSPASEAEHLQGEDEDVVKWCAAGLYAGAGDTTVSAVVSFILLMALYPRVQEKARREIFEAQVAGGGSVDVHKLEYLGAVMKEVLRFAPVGNLALPHRVSQDDVYEGYHIPKGSTVIANVWAILHDRNMYSEPFTFRPERFMSGGAPGATKGSVGKGSEPDPKRWAFGFGRRACPGLYFADTTVLCAIYHILAKCTISLPKPETSKGPLSSSHIQFTTGNTSHIKPFPIVIQPTLKPRDQ